MIEVVPYVSAGPLNFGLTSESDCKSIFGNPKKHQFNREGSLELYYDEFIARFSSDRFIEMTVVPPTIVRAAGVLFDWDFEALRRASLVNGTPIDIFGFIVFLKLGIAITGLHDDDKGQLALTIFRLGAFDPLLIHGKDFHV